MQQDVIISNKLGLHARAAAKLVAVASGYQSEIQIHKAQKNVNAKSIMAVLMLAASKGTELKVTTEGDDASDALDAIVHLIEDKFGEGE